MRHVLGNHCLDNPKPVVMERLRMPGAYYSAPLGPGWRLVALDTTEMSGHSGEEESSELGREAGAFLAAHPLSEAEPQMSPWNGGIGVTQMAWLGAQLQEAADAGERVLVIAHHQAREEGIGVGEAGVGMGARRLRPLCTHLPSPPHPTLT